MNFNHSIVDFCLCLSPVLDSKFLVGKKKCVLGFLEFPPQYLLEGLTGIVAQ